MSTAAPTIKSLALAKLNLRHAGRCFTSIKTLGVMNPSRIRTNTSGAAHEQARPAVAFEQGRVTCCGVAGWM